MSKIVGTIVAIIVIAAGVWFFSDKSREASNQNQDQENQNQNNSQSQSFSFGNPKKSAHYETNTPAHGSVLAAAPINIVIDFNFDLAAPSSISITNNGEEYGLGETIIDTNKLTMRRNFDQAAPDGLYKVSYKACWPDRSCHDGHFEFAIDRALSATYDNLENTKDITIRMSEIKFKPQNINIKTGTKITWVNDDDVEHYVNTDSHPAHTYHLPQNSRALKKGETYSLTFDSPGIYPYHCSAHADSMVGNIVVKT